MNTWPDNLAGVLLPISSRTIIMIISSFETNAARRPLLSPRAKSNLCPVSSQDKSSAKSFLLMMTTVIIITTIIFITNSMMKQYNSAHRSHSGCSSNATVVVATGDQPFADVGLDWRDMFCHHQRRFSSKAFPIFKPLCRWSYCVAAASPVLTIVALAASFDQVTGRYWMSRSAITMTTIVMIVKARGRWRLLSRRNRQAEREEQEEIPSALAVCYYFCFFFFRLSISHRRQKHLCENFYHDFYGWQDNELQLSF